MAGEGSQEAEAKEDDMQAQPEDIDEGQEGATGGDPDAEPDPLDVTSNVVVHDDQGDYGNDDNDDEEDDYYAEEDKYLNKFINKDSVVSNWVTKQVKQGQMGQNLF